MTSIEELDLILKWIRKYNLPLSPILEYAVNEKKKEYSNTSAEEADETTPTEVDSLHNGLSSAFAVPTNIIYRNQRKCSAHIDSTVSLPELEDECSEQGNVAKYFAGKHIWMYWPDAKACQFKENVEKGFMACEPLGGYDIGDINMIGENGIKAAVEAKYGYANSSSIKLMTTIFRDVKIGDYIIARSDFDNIVGIGVVSGDYYYDKSRPCFRHCRRVKWINTVRWSFPEEFQKKGKWHRVTIIDKPFRKIAEQVINVICEENLK